jgi:AcrR family transcriptional regulator
MARQRAEADEAPLKKSELTRQSILDAAARMFRMHGYSGTRLSDIADEIGMKAGSLYYHFPSREALVEAVMDLGLQRTHAAVLDRLSMLPADAGHLARLQVAIETHLLSVLEQEDYTSASIKLIWQVPAGIRERQIADQRAYGALWRKLLEDARKGGAIRADVDLSVARMAIVGALNWAADWYKPGKLTPKRIARDICAMVLNGLVAQDETAAAKRRPATPKRAKKLRE